MGSDVRFIVTNLKGLRKAAQREVFCPPKPVQDMERWTRTPPNRGGRQTSFLHIGIYWLLHARHRGVRAAMPTVATTRRAFVPHRGAQGCTQSTNRAAMLASMTGAITTRGQ
jgi:hypothetical protein